MFIPQQQIPPSAFPPPCSPDFGDLLFLRFVASSDMAELERRIVSVNTSYCEVHLSLSPPWDRPKISRAKPFLWHFQDMACFLFCGKFISSAPSCQTL